MLLYRGNRFVCRLLPTRLLGKRLADRQKAVMESLHGVIVVDPDYSQTNVLKNVSQLAQGSLCFRTSWTGRLFGRF